MAFLFKRKFIIGFIMMVIDKSEEYTTTYIILQMLDVWKGKEKFLRRYLVDFYKRLMERGGK